MKVLHVIGRRPRGGIGTFLLNMVENQSDNNIKHEFLVHDKEAVGDFDEQVKAKGLVVHVLPELKLVNLYKILYLYKDFYCSFRLFDIVHIHSPVIFMINYIFGKLYLNDAVIGCHGHSTRYSDGGFKSLRNLFLYYPVRFFSGFNIACSRQAGKFLFGNKDFFVIKNGVSVDDFKYNRKVSIKLRKELDFGAEQIIIGHVGNFLPVKNHMFLIELMHKLSQVTSKYCMVFVGSGDLFDHCTRMAERLEVGEYIKFLGDRRDVNDLMSLFDIFVLPSKYEGVPLVGVEAQAAGLNILFSNNVPKDIDIVGNCKFLSTERELDIWVSQILDLTTTTALTQTNRMSYAKKVKDKGYDINDTVIQLEKIYRNAHV